MFYDYLLTNQYLKSLVSILMNQQGLDETKPLLHKALSIQQQTLDTHRPITYTLYR